MILLAPSYSPSLVIFILLSLTLLVSFLNTFIFALLALFVKPLIPLFKSPYFSFDALSYWSCSYLLSAPAYIFITRLELLQPTRGTLLRFLFISQCTLCFGTHLRLILELLLPTIPVSLFVECILRPPLTFPHHFTIYLAFRYPLTFTTGAFTTYYSCAII